MNIVECRFNENSSFLDAVDVEIGTTHLELLKRRSASNVITPSPSKILQNSLKCVLHKERLQLLKT
ncbi:MAG: hypothetical protein ACW97V_11515 [Promethearchaeota archaeon]|jgi:hypothetical protein